jgi:hypothetical protein
MGKSWTPALRRKPRQPAAPSKKTLTTIPDQYATQIAKAKRLQFLLTRVE